MTQERRALDMASTSPASAPERRRRAPPARAYALAAMLASLAGPAAADMVVIASTASEILPGRIVQPGQPLLLPEGTQVTLLASTGATMIMVPPGGAVSDIPSVKGDGEVLTVLAAVVAGGQGSTRLGAARAIGDEICAARTAADPVQEIARLGLEGCDAAAAQQLDELRRRRVPASIYLTSERGRAAAVRAGQPLGLEVTVSLPAHVTCWHKAPDGTVSPLAIAGESKQPLPSSRPFAVSLTAGQAGRNLVACAATDRPPTGTLTLAAVQTPGPEVLATDQITVQVSP
ncbi:MAG TPA: hypothetical protein PKA09_10635 [Geminicoccus sp.]|nr:hypothetical protein [Geminicoccus sp.]